MKDAEVIRALAQLGIDELSVKALPLLPLVQVAWADGEVQQAERALIHKLAKEQFALDEEGLRLLDNWLRYPPTADYLKRGRNALILVAQRESELLHEDTLPDVLTFSKKVARAAGGLFGIGAVSKSEQAAITEIANALHVAQGTALSTAQEAALAPSFEGQGQNNRVTITFSTSALDIVARGGVLEPEQGPLFKCPIDREGSSIGSAPEATIRVDYDDHVAAMHCLVVERNRKFYVQDLDSEHGTWVNDERIAERRLLGGESIRVGREVSFTFKLLRRIPKQMAL